MKKEQTFRLAASSGSAVTSHRSVTLSFLLTSILSGDWAIRVAADQQKFQQFLQQRSVNLVVRLDKIKIKIAFFNNTTSSAVKFGILKKIFASEK